MYQATETRRQHTIALMITMGRRRPLATGLTRLPLPKGFFPPAGADGSAGGAPGSGARMGPVRLALPAPPPGINFPARLITRGNQLSEGDGLLLAKNASERKLRKQVWAFPSKIRGARCVLRLWWCWRDALPRVRGQPGRLACRCPSKTTDRPPDSEPWEQPRERRHDSHARAA